MLSFLSRVGNILGLYSSEPHVDLDGIAAVLDAEDDNQVEEDTLVTEQFHENGVKCQHRVGVVSALYDNHGYISEKTSIENSVKISQLYFNRKDGPPDLKVGNKVVFLVFRMSDDSEWIVRKILYVQNECWDQTENEEDNNDIVQAVVQEECETAYKHVIAKMTGREKRTIIAGEFRFSLDDVEIDFLPIEGDWLMLQSIVQTESRADTLLVVDKVTPLRSQQRDGRVSHWSADTNEGIIDSEVVFYREACEPGYIPRLGDEVTIYCIESEQGQLTWRAVQVVPTADKDVRLSHDPQMLAELLQNKEGIVISEDTNCGIINIGQEAQIQIEVKNESNAKYKLLNLEMNSCESQVKLIQPPAFKPTVIEPQKYLNFMFNVKGRFIGRSTELVVFCFEGFKIGRQLVVDVQCGSLILSNNRNKGNQRTKQEPLTAKKLLATRNGFIVPGVRPIKPASFVPVNLGMFKIPDNLTNLVLGIDSAPRRDEIINKLLEHYRYLNGPLDPINYKERWHLLIHIEELEYLKNISRYDTTASLHRVQDYLSLEIEGLSEKRPSLVVGDKVVAKEAWTNENSWDSGVNSVGYEGYIHKVLSNEVLMKFNPNFHDSCSGVYLISFTANRTSFRRQHQAVNVAYQNLQADWLFPSKIVYQTPQVSITDEEDYKVPQNLQRNCNLENDEDFIRTKNSVSKEINNENCVNVEKKKDEKTSECDINPFDDIVDSNKVLSSGKLSNKISSEIEDSNKFKDRTNYLFNQKQATDNLNIYKNVGENNLSIDLLTVKKDIDDIVNTATRIASNEEKTKSKKSKRTKTMVSDILEKTTQVNSSQKISPPRIPVVARFLQNSNCPSTEESSTNVKNVLHQLASLSPNVTSSNKNMKTLEEIEKSLLNQSNKANIQGGVEKSSVQKKLLEEEIKSHLPPDKAFDVKTPGNRMQLENIESTTYEANKNVRGRKTNNKNTKESSKGPSSISNKITWNSNIEMKLGNEKVAENNIPQWKRRKIRWFNSSLNHYQKEAIRNILRGEARPMPYVIFGPPGTGKTITLVETVLQTYFLIPGSRMLIATPSNSAADLVCERLLESGLLAPGDLLRLVGFHYAEQDRVPDALRPYCGCADIKAREDSQDLPSQEGVVNISRHAIGRHRITVGTCNSLGVLYQMGFPRGHFTHVLVDEAGQATEPEILIPLVFLNKSSGQAVLAGDPLQLGPVVLSKVGEHFGLGESLLSRLLLRTPYCRDVTGYPLSGGYNPHLVTKLVFNYRSLPEILKLPNEMFYSGDLVPQVSEDTSQEARVLEMVRELLPLRPNRNPPALVFHGIRGTNCQALDSPSWHNPHEAVQAIMYLQALYASGLDPDQCGILTPYQAQVAKIREMLETLEVPIPKVGSVEEFQGQERMAIILSTVRSSPRLIESDVRHTVGFVASPRRVNVAITRARALLIVLGNPHLLARDHYWRSILTYCVHNNAYIGCDLPDLND